jgi:hypothetical protein
MAAMSAGTIGTGPPGTTPGELAPAPVQRRRRWLRWTGVTLAVLLAGTAISAGIWAAHYQPADFGGSFGPLQGQITGRQVNTFGFQGQLYVPPQARHHGTLDVSIANNGPFPVTIESATLNPPDPWLRAGEPLRDDGTATYWTEPPGQVGPGRPLAGTVLQSHQAIDVRLPLTTAFCRITSAGYSVLNEFSVTVRFLAWTHHVTISWTNPNSPDQGAIMAGSPSVTGPPGLCHPQTAG